MSREQDPPRTRRMVEGVERPGSEEDTSGNSFEQPRYIKHTSTPKTRRPSPRRENFSDEEDSDGSSGVKRSERSARTQERRGSRGYVDEDRRRRSSRRRRRKLEDRRFKGERKRRASDSSFSGKRLGTADASEISERRKSSSQDGEEEEVPITEILKRAQTRYERPQPLPELTTDKIYIQGRDGFSVVKVPPCRAGLQDETKGMKRTGGTDILHGESFPPIRVAVLGQKFWKSTGLVYQGLLAGMALMHFVMMYAYFDPTVEFVVDYSRISEIYSTVFSFLIALCTVAVFDKFDLARFGVQHLREVYTDCGRSIISVPVYLVVFCLHQFSLRTEDRLALVQFSRLNGSTVHTNGTNFDGFLAELNGWQRVTVSKDLLAVVAWLFVALGMKQDAFLTHLRSMERNDEVSA